MSIPTPGSTRYSTVSPAVTMREVRKSFMCSTRVVRITAASPLHMPTNSDSMSRRFFSGMPLRRVFNFANGCIPRIWLISKKG